MAYIEHNGQKHAIPTGGDPAATFESLQGLLPEMKNAKLGKPDKDGNYKVESNFGRKG